MTFDFFQAKRAFEEYLDEYDREDDKIRLKIVHTYAVVEAAAEISRRMGLSEEDRELAEIIGLLHDIGRFEQLKRFNSFNPDNMNHAVYGAELLFGEEKMIRRFVADDTFDALICEAISRHSDFRLEGVEDERTLLHAKLIRDADKLDNCRVKIAEPMEVLLDMTAEEVGKERITSKVWESCLQKESVLLSDRVTKMDYWVSYLAMYFDVNFPETFQIIRENQYIRRIADRIHYEDKDTAEKMEILVKELEEYM